MTRNWAAGQGAAKWHHMTKYSVPLLSLCAGCSCVAIVTHNLQGHLCHIKPSLPAPTLVFTGFFLVFLSYPGLEKWLTVTLLSCSEFGLISFLKFREVCWESWGKNALCILPFWLYLLRSFWITLQTMEIYGIQRSFQNWSSPGKQLRFSILNLRLCWRNKSFLPCAPSICLHLTLKFCVVLDL